MKGATFSLLLRKNKYCTDGEKYEKIMNVLRMRSEISESVNNEKRSRHAHDDSHVLRLSGHKI